MSGMAKFIKKNWKVIVGIVISVGALVGGSTWAAQPVVIEGTVNLLSWDRSIDVLKMTTVKRDGWSVPTGGRVYDTRWEYKGQKNVPSGVDSNGFTTYKQISEFATKYYYEIDEWNVTRRVVTNGYSNSTGSLIKPYWGEIGDLSENEKTGTRREHYYIHVIEHDNKSLKTLEVGENTWRQIDKGMYVRAKVGRLNQSDVKEIEILD